MKCREVKQLLNAYLDNEVNLSERRLINSHLASCENCQRKLAVLAEDRDRLINFLKDKAAQTAPSPQALSRLQEKLADDAHRPPHGLKTWLPNLAPEVSRNKNPIKGVFPMKTKLAIAFLAVFLLLAGTVAFVPSVRAEVERILAVMTTGYSELSEPFPLDTSAPGYLEEFEGFPIAGSGTVSASVGGGDSPSSSLSIYQKGDNFLVFRKTVIETGADLPDGEVIMVNGLPGVLNTSLSGEYRHIAPEGIDEDGNPVTIEPILIPYTNANQITWKDGNKVYEMLSNLPVEVMLEIAKELILMP